ncbi:MAG: hypothetical protein AB8B51_16990 [Sedimentitalea sp.]
MRPLLHGDISSAARALLKVRPAFRREHCLRLIEQAQAARVYCDKNGALHALWGNGSLMSAARKIDLPPEPTFDDARYRECFMVVLECLGTLRAHSVGNLRKDPEV